MPCYSIQTSSVVFQQNTDVTLFAKAMETLGYRVLHLNAQAGTFDFVKGYESGKFNRATGEFTMTSAEALNVDRVNAFKRAYSAQVVQATANRFGWKVSQSSDNKMQLTRRI